MITEEFGAYSDTVEEAAPVEACTKCTACNTACPVARTTELFRGP
jgi:succinate dehydrogenase/fumarate reductase-like Fe-S protein